jgi:hypothetical protein
LCTGMKKLTGSTGENGDRVCHCIGIEKKILKKMYSGFLGLTSDEDNVPFDVAGDEEVGGEDSYDINDNVALETWSNLNSSFKLENSEHPDEIPCPSSNDIIPRPQVQQDLARINEGDDVTPHPQGVDIGIAAAQRRAASTARSERTKNSSKKIRSAP